MSTEKVHIMIKRWTKRISAVDFVLFIGIINLKVSLGTRNKTEVLTMKMYRNDIRLTQKGIFVHLGDMRKGLGAAVIA